MSKIFIATTTINSPSKALVSLSKLKNFQLVVALDQNSCDFNLKNTVILSPEYQKKKWNKLSNLVGWNCVARRNFAILECLERGAEIIALVDDDNIPLNNWSKDILVNKIISADEIKTNKDVFDPVGYTNYSNLWHRGFPLEMIYGRKYKKNKIKKKIKPDIQAAFWNGDPDIDAVARIIQKPICNFKKKYFPFFSKKISPFNSQNTFLSRRVFHDYFLFPGIGRMEDIWASYYVTAKKKYKAIYSEPTVFQKRNKHNLIKDFHEEILGYENNYSLIKELNKNPENIYKFIPKKTAQAFDEWKKTVDKIL